MSKYSFTDDLVNSRGEVVVSTRFFIPNYIVDEIKSDGYEQGKADAFTLIKGNWEQLKSAYRMNGHNLDTDMWLNDFLSEQLKESK